MKDIASRISEVVQKSGLTKTAFASRVNLSQPHISQICSGIKIPSDRTISDICREFGVNEIWLRTGDGQPFRQLSRTEELSAFFGDVLSDAPNFRSALITVLARMSPDEWQLLERKARELAQEMEKTGPD